jgi:dienelactone hydrolase
VARAVDPSGPAPASRAAPIRAFVRGAAIGAAAGALIVTLAAAFLAGRSLHLVGPLVDGLLGVALVAAAMAGVNGILRLVAWGIERVLALAGRRRPARSARERGRGILQLVRQPLVASSLLIVLVLWLGRDDGPFSVLGALVPFEILILVGAIAGLLAGAGLALLDGARTTPVRLAGAAALGGAIVLAAVATGWAVLPGVGPPPASEAESAIATVAELELDDPSEPGSYRVATATYGSGLPTRRAEFASDATWRTAAVDASGVLDRPDGVATLYADLVWGFDTDALPVNGLAWYATDAPAPMPVVLVVHGNHAAGDSSDPGYAYLAEHLASRGMLAVSVDENFLNGDAFFDYDGAEIGIRAYLLLSHLDTLRGWNADPAHPLHERLDLDRIALVGHSRGGEAAALAATLEAGDRQVVGMPPAPTGFGIRAVVAIAPSDGMYLGTPIALEGVDYLVLQGARDGDLPAFSGLRTYHRARLTDPDNLKVAIYAGRANHGRFNTVWDDADAGPIHSWMLDRGALLDAADQERLAKALVGAFLARSLQGDHAYDAFFREPRAGRSWLPEDTVESHWESGGRVAIGSLSGARLDRDRLLQAGFTEAASADPMLRDGSMQGDSALRLAWTDSVELEAPIDLDESATIDPDGWLTISLGTPGERVPDPIVVLRDASGHESAQRLSDVSPPRPVIPVSLWKIDHLGERYLPAEALRWPAERFLQTHAIPLESFAAVDPELDRSRLAAVILRFTEAGTAFLDDVGFEPSP